MPSFFSFSFNSGLFVQFLSYSSLERPLLTINFLHYFSKVIHNSGSYVTRKESLKNAIFKIVRMWNRFNKIFPHPDDFDVLSFSSAYLQLWLFCNFTRLSLFEGNEILSDLTAIFILERRDIKFVATDTGHSLPGVIIHQPTRANGDHHILSGDVMKACILSIFKVAIRQPYVGDNSVAKRQCITETMVKPRICPPLTEKNV